MINIIEGAGGIKRPGRPELVLEALGFLEENILLEP